MVFYAGLRFMLSGKRQQENTPADMRQGPLAKGLSLGITSGPCTLGSGARRTGNLGQIRGGVDDLSPCDGGLESQRRVACQKLTSARTINPWSFSSPGEVGKPESLLRPAFHQYSYW